MHAPAQPASEENDETTLQTQLDYLRQRLETSPSKRDRKQLEKDIETTALHLGKLKIAKNTNFEEHTVRGTFDPPMPNKRLQASNLELFALNEEVTEKTESGLHKKLAFIHSKSVQHVASMRSSPTASTSSSSSSLSSHNGGMDSHYNPAMTGWNPSAPIAANWWVDRLYDGNGYFVYAPQHQLPMAMDAMDNGQLVQQSEESSEDRAFSDCDAEDAVSSFSEPAYRRDHSASDASESPPLWVDAVEVNDQISPDEESNCSLDDVLAEKRKSRSDRKRRKRKLIEKLNQDNASKCGSERGRKRKRRKKSSKHRRSRSKKRRHGRRSSHKSKRKRHSTRKSQSVDLEIRPRDMSDSEAKDADGEHIPVTAQGLSKREEFRKKYAHILKN